jgi:Fe-S cluster assembly protein SufD
MPKPEAAPYLEAFRPDPAEPAWLADSRRAALAAFGERGFPSRREEAWRFTNLRPLSEKFFPSIAPAIATLDAKALDAYALGIPTHRLVFLNGRFSEAHSNIGALPNGAWLASTARTARERPDLLRRALDPSDLAGGQPFAALNAATFADGFVLSLEPGVALDRPVEIVTHAFVENSSAIPVRNALLLSSGARATVFETGFGGGPYWSNSVTQIELGPRSALARIKLQNEGAAAIAFDLERVALSSDASFSRFGLTLGALLSRQDIFVSLADAAACGVNGAYLLRGDQDTTNAVSIDHVGPNATTRELFKGVLDGQAHGAFLGRIAVRPGAQKTDAQQTSRGILLSDRAAIDTKPELEIFADDVKCSHGAAVGDLDRDALFYLRARGIDADAARRMLIEGFVLDAIETVAQPELRDHLARQVRRWLGEGAAP